MAVVVIINGRNVYVLKLLGQWICYPFVFFQRVAEWPFHGRVCRIYPKTHPAVKIQMMIAGYIREFCFSLVNEFLAVEVHSVESAVVRLDGCHIPTRGNINDVRLLVQWYHREAFLGVVVVI